MEPFFLSYRDAKRTEAKYAHGYPATLYLQAMLVYSCGLYTAKEQGIVKKGVYFQKFYKAHYFDWILFGQRSLKYGVAGGLVLGTFLFGSASVSLARMINKYHYYTAWEKPDPRNVTNLYFPKDNN